MTNRVHVAHHPVHPMLVPFPIGLWVFSLASDVAFRLGAGPVWDTIAFWTMVGGIIGALAAANPGFIDFQSLNDPRTWRIAVVHLSLNLTIVVLYLVNLWVRTYGMPGDALPITLSAVAVGLLLVSGWFGGTLVYERGVAVAPEPDVIITTQGRGRAA